MGNDRADRRNAPFSLLNVVRVSTAPTQLSGFLTFALLLIALAVPAAGQPTETRIAIYADQASIPTYPNRRVPAFASMSDHDPQLVVALGDVDHRTAKDLPGWIENWEETATCITPAGCDFENHLGGLPYLRVPGDHDGAGCNDANRYCPGTLDFIEAFKARWTDDPYPGPSLLRFKSVGHVFVVALDTRTERDRNTKADTPAKRMLSPVQLAQVVAGVAASTEPWVVILSDVPWHDGKATDSWQGFTFARLSLATALAPLCPDRRCIFVSADVHNRGGLDDGSWAACEGVTIAGVWPEMSVPHVNLPRPNNLPRLGPCWSHGSNSGTPGAGYALLRATAHEAVLETRTAQGGLLRTLTLTR